jgi:LCP family protein required for cell wall assembly
MEHDVIIPERNAGRATKRIQPSGRRVFLIAVTMVVALALAFFGGVYLLSERYLGDVQRLPDPFVDIPSEERPAKPPGGGSRNGETWLLAGLDTRSEVPTTGGNAESTRRGRSDALMLVHLTGDREQAYVVSIPRDSWVPIPDHGHAKINAAYAYGGPTLAIRTVEQVTDIRIDHFAVIDWAGFRSLTDALGGVTIMSERAGEQHLNGEQALEFVGERYSLPRGDLDRVQRQQAFLRAVVDKTLAEGTLVNPVKLTGVLDSIADAVSVDGTLSNADLRTLALSFRNLEREDVVFVTAPVAGLDSVEGQSIVRLDEQQSSAFWAAVATDQLPAYIQQQGAETLPEKAP